MGSVGSSRRDFVTIANGASLSDVLDLRGRWFVGIEMPSVWTAANITFQGSTDGVTFVDLYTPTGSERSVTAAASRYIVLSPQDYGGLNYVKLRSGTSATPVNQAAERTIYVSVLPLL